MAWWKGRRSAGLNARRRAKGGMCVIEKTEDYDRDRRFQRRDREVQMSDRELAAEGT